MADGELRILERAARDARDDTSVWIRYVRALDREEAPPPEDLASVVRRVRASFADSPEHAIIDVGDEVWVEEVDTPWIIGGWRGVVMNVLLGLDDRTKGEFLSFRVRPIFPDEDDPDATPLKWRTKPLPEQRVRGLLLDRMDRLSLLAKKR